MKLVGLMAITVALSAQVVGAACHDNTPMGVMGYSTEKGWGIYLKRDGKHWKAERTAVEPRMFSANLRTGTLAYIAINGDVILKSGGKETTLLSATPELAFTQPYLSSQRDTLYLTGLIRGNSQDTDIYYYDPVTKKAQPVSLQRSSQFEPQVVGDWLYYSSVSCVTGCASIIQDVWRRNLISGEAEQLTMTKGIAREPAIAEPDGSLYFSANTAGNYHIWKLGAGSMKQVTDGAVTDTAPKVSPSGDVYFIRQTPEGTGIMCKGDGGSAAVGLPKGINRVRGLQL